VTRSNSVIAHATCMGVAFAFLMPMGAILIRATRFRHLVWYHAAIMLFAYVLALVGLGLGIYIAIVPESQVFVFPPSYVLSFQDCLIDIFFSKDPGVQWASRYRDSRNRTAPPSTPSWTSSPLHLQTEAHSHHLGNHPCVVGTRSRYCGHHKRRAWVAA